MWLKKLLNLSKTEGLSDPARLKKITYRGGLISFSIPEHWLEEYEEEGGGTFYENIAHSGTLRLNVMTAESNEESEKIDVDLEVKTLAGKHNGIAVMLDEGNAYARYDQNSSENGQNITIRYWNVYNPVPPNHLRIAVFSYTLLSSQFNEVKFQAELEMLEHEIALSRFSTALGTTN